MRDPWILVETKSGPSRPVGNVAAMSYMTYYSAERLLVQRFVDVHLALYLADLERTQQHRQQEEAATLPQAAPSRDPDGPTVNPPSLALAETGASRDPSCSAGLRMQMDSAQRANFQFAKSLQGGRRLRAPSAVGARRGCGDGREESARLRRATGRGVRPGTSGKQGEAS